MANFRITPTNSVLTTGNSVHAFTSDTPGADTLTVDANAYLQAEGIGARGAVLNNTKAWKVTVNGLIDSKQSDAIFLGDGNAAMSAITIGAGGKVFGESAGSSGIVALSGVNIVNAGMIAGPKDGITFGGAAAHSVRNTGTIDGIFYAIRDLDGLSADTVINSGKINGDVFLNGGNDTLTNSGRIVGDVTAGLGNDTLKNTADIIGRLYLGEGDDKVTNAGKIADSIFCEDGDDTVTNSGSVGDKISLGNGFNKLTNSGSIAGNISGGNDRDVVKNSGQVGGMVDLGGGDGTLTNSGMIDGKVSFGNENDTITNSGIINSYVDMLDGTNKLTNSGTIGGSIFGRAGDDTVTNSGTIKGNLNLEDGKNTVMNKGIIEGNLNLDSGNDSVSNTRTVLGNVNLGEGNNALTNSGVIYGNVNGGAGSDTVKNAGAIGGVVDLGGDDDSFTGGKYIEVVEDSAGSDNIKLEGGHDFYVAKGDFNPAFDGTDTIDAGSGIDTYDASLALGSVWINLDKIAHDLAPFAPPGAGLVAANTATGLDIGGATKDTIKNFENAIGGANDDTIYGSAANNILEGRVGNDILFGNGGMDELNGGAGSDALFGGAGKDFLNGGSDADSFLFAAISDSGVGIAARDLITDFETGADVINLLFIDANTSTRAVDDAFSFIGNQAFGGVAGQLRAYWTTDGQIVEGDVNGDGRADFSIEVAKTAFTTTLTSTDFIL